MHSKFARLDELAVSNKRVLLRVDFNVPILGSEIIDDSRIVATLPTIRQLINEGAAVILLSHLGRPEEGKYDPEYSLALIADYLSEALNISVPLVADWSEARINSGEVIMLENIRFKKGEKENADDLAKSIAEICDIYVNEAFASTHREHASLHCIAKYMTTVYAGPLFLAEINALSRCIDRSKSPFVAMIGGYGRAATKIGVIKAMLDKANHVMLGGQIANTFLKAAGREIGYSTFHSSLVAEAKKIIELASNRGKPISLPTDVVVRKRAISDQTLIEKSFEDILFDEIIVDIGTDTIKRYSDIVKGAATIFWNGPPGVYEVKKSSHGTYKLAQSIAKSDAFSLVSGGDTLHAISKFNLKEQVSFLSTGGQALLEYIQGNQLPGISMLEESARVRDSLEQEY